MGSSCCSSLNSCYSSSLYQELCCYWSCFLCSPNHKHPLFWLPMWLLQFLTEPNLFWHPRSLHPGRLCHSPSPDFQVWHFTRRAAPAAPCWWYLNIPTAGSVWGTDGNSPKSDSVEVSSSWCYQRKKATVCALSEQWSLRHTKSL